MDHSSIEIQHQVRENAKKLQEEFKTIKNFEQDMKRKEQDMLKIAAKEVAELVDNVPVRSSENFQKYHAAEESTKKLKEMNLEEKEAYKVDSKKEADSFKEKGNEFVKAKNYESAIKMYTMAIETHSNQGVYYSNRSQCFLSLEKYAECIEDTKKAIELDKSGSKAYFRQMTAFEKMGNDLKALKACKDWMETLPDDQLSKTNYDRLHNKIIEESSRTKRAKVKWSKYPEQTNFVEKKAHLQSKKPLKFIPVHLKKSQSPIPDNVIDKIFNNNTGEHVPEPETNSQLFKANFFNKDFAKPKPVKSSAAAESDTVDDKSKLNEKNEFLKACESVGNKLQVPSLEELEALKNNLIVLPLTGPQFYATWKELSEELKFLYLKDIAISKIEFGGLLGAQLDSQMLSEVIHVIHKYFLHLKIPYIQMLFSVSKNSEMSILAMFTEEDDKKKLNELLSNVLHGGDNNVNNMIQQIKQNFQF